MKKNIVTYLALLLALTSCGSAVQLASTNQQFADGIYYRPEPNKSLEVASQQEMDELVSQTLSSELFVIDGKNDTLYLPKNKTTQLKFNRDSTITINVYDRNDYDLMWNYSWAYSPWYMRGWYGYRPWYDPWYYDPGLRAMYGPYFYGWNWGWGFRSSWYWDPWYWDPWVYDPWYYDAWYGPWGHHYGYWGGYYGYPYYYGYHGWGGPHHGYFFNDRRDPDRRPGVGGMPSTSHASRGFVGGASSARRTASRNVGDRLPVRSASASSVSRSASSASRLNSSAASRTASCL